MEPITATSIAGFLLTLGVLGAIALCVWLDDR
jgi:hypothetical protein